MKNKKFLYLVYIIVLIAITFMDILIKILMKLDELTGTFYTDVSHYIPKIMLVTVPLIILVIFMLRKELKK